MSSSRSQFVAEVQLPGGSDPATMTGVWFDHARYDSLQRLLSATGSGWSQTFTYDGFSNLVGKVGTGGAPSWSGSVDAATNRLSGLTFDANGNQTGLQMTSGMTDYFAATYDVANRLTYVENPTQSRRSWYEYDAGNKRIYEKRFDGGTQEWVYFFGVTGQRLARYTFTVAGSAITFTQDTASVWFGGKLVQKVNSLGSSYAYEDRLGSVGKYLPYGEDKPGASGNPGNDNEKFATYTRDANTGIDYADQRWHAQGTGRFLTADPYQASAGPGDPGSWNRYGYVEGDPIGYADSTGLIRNDCAYNKAGCQPGDWDDGVPLGGGGLASGCPVVWMGNGFAPNLSLCYVPPLAYEPPAQSKPRPSCDDPGSTFILDNWVAVSAVTQQYNFPINWAFAWLAQESTWGRSVMATQNGNYLGMTKPVGQPVGNWAGEQVCGPNAYTGTVNGADGLVFSCFSGIAASLTAAFQHSRYGPILGYASVDPYLTVTAQFQALASAGWDPKNPVYGRKIADTLPGVDRRIDCLRERGLIH